MSAEGTIYGCIFGGGLIGSRMHIPYPLNKEAIDALPQHIDWNAKIVLTKNMFTVPMPEEDFYRYQMIHFGASFNHLHTYWEAWLNQFEALLRTLIWHVAYVHMEAEAIYKGTYQWRADGLSFQQNPTQPIQKWHFEGGPRSFDL